jgi:hypothetical protein
MTLFSRQGLPRHFFGDPTAVHIGGVNKVAPIVQEAIDHPRGFRLISLPAECHRSQT